MPNNQTLTEYLDHCAKMPPTRPKHYKEYVERATALWFAALSAGWSVSEIDEAYYRRFGYRVKRQER